MRACVSEGDGEISVEQVAKPELPSGGAIAKIVYASICGTDLRTYRFGSDKLSVPRIIGHEACCVIDEIDPQIKDFKVGDRVIFAPAIGCGKCKSCLRGRTNMCDNLTTIGFEYEGTFAQFCAIPKQAFVMNNVIKISDEIGDDEACVVEPVACAINAQSFLDIGKGDNVLIYGAGYLGCIHAELALIKGADKVIVAEISEKRRVQASKDVDNIFILDSADEGFAKQVEEIVGDSGVDVVITACPSGITHKQALELVYKNGRVSLFGGLAGEAKGYLDSNLIHYKEIGVFGAHASTPKQNREALELITNKTLKVRKYIDIFPLDKITDAFDCLVNETIVKAIVKP